MSKYGAKGYHDGREGRPSREPNDFLDHLLSSHQDNKEKCREDREYRDGYREGKEDRKR